MKKKTIKELAHQKFKNVRQFDNHAFPQTRRDFIKLGLMAGGGMLIPNLFPVNAFADVAKFPRIPFLVIDCAGGAALAGSFLTGRKGGPEDLAKSYEGNGWDPRASGALDKTFGVPMSALASTLLAGLKESLPSNLQAANQNNFKMTSHVHFSLDDTSVNKTSALTYISKAGLIGNILKNGLGTQPTLSGGNSAVLLEESRYKPKIITNLNDVLNLTSIGNGYENLSQSAKKALLESIAQSTDMTVKEAYDQLKMYGAKHEQGNPQSDQTMNSLYNLNNDSELLQAAIVMNVVKGFTGPGVITIPGCDYHNGSRDEGDRVDRLIGQAIGRAVAYASAQNSPLFIQLITDGSISATSASARDWQSDSPLRSMSVMGYFNPSKAVTQRKLQIGHVSENGETDISNVISAAPEKSVTSTVVNYLNVIGDKEAIDTVLGRLQPSEVDEVLAFD